MANLPHFAVALSGLNLPVARWRGNWHMKKNKKTPKKTRHTAVVAAVTLRQ